MAARSLFELLLDLKALAVDPALAEKFFAFTWVNRYHKAWQLSSFLAEHPEVDAGPHQAAIALVNKPGVEQDREQLCRQHGWVDKRGKLNWPKHWSGKDTPARAWDAGIEYEEIYRSEFFMQSYYVHAGPAGVDALPREALECVFGVAHARIQCFFAEATRVICDRFHLFEATPGLRDRLEKASEVTGFYAVKAVLEASQAT